MNSKQTQTIKLCKRLKTLYLDDSNLTLKDFFYFTYFKYLTLTKGYPKSFPVFCVAYDMMSVYFSMLCVINCCMSFGLFKDDCLS